MNAVDRPSFVEGQLLTAADLELAVDYVRETMERHAIDAHTYGVVVGLEVVLRAGTTGGKLDAFVDPGVGVDRRGRQIVLTKTTPLRAEVLKEDGSYPVYAWVTELPVVTSTVANACGSTTSSRVREQSNVAVFLSAAGAASPAADGIQLGTLTRKNGAFVDDQHKTDGRHGGGVRAHEIVAAENAIVVHGKDAGPATITVKGTVEGVHADDGTPPKFRIAGGNIELCAVEDSPHERTVFVGYEQSGAGDALAVRFGNTEAESHVRVVDGAGTELGRIEGADGGRVKAHSAAFVDATFDSNIVVGSESQSLRIAALDKKGDVGIATTASLPLEFGSGAGDAVMFLSGDETVATLDTTTLELTNRHLALGLIDTNATGIAVQSGAALEVRTSLGEIAMKPGGKPFLSFTNVPQLINHAAGDCDVTPATFTGGPVSLLRIGPIAIMFGSVSSEKLQDAGADSSADVFEVRFPRRFTAPPVFLVTAVQSSTLLPSLILATVTSVDATKALCAFQLQHTRGDMRPVSPTLSGGAMMSWVALGTM